MALFRLLNKQINFIKNIFFNKKSVSTFLLMSMLFSFATYLLTFPKNTSAVSRHDARGGALIVGTEQTKSYSNAGS